MRTVKFVIALIWATTYKTSMEGSFLLAGLALVVWFVARLDDKFREEERRRGGYRGYIRRVRRNYY